MRRDVRMLGEVLGDVIRESGGPDLLADVERLRRAVIAARQPSAGADAAEEIAAMVGGLAAGAGRGCRARLHALFPPDEPG
jgi:phosphoenolpyruvate carboxylase